MLKIDRRIKLINIECDKDPRIFVSVFFVVERNCSKSFEKMIATDNDRWATWLHLL